jgi:hypothetical protein
VGFDKDYACNDDADNDHDGRIDAADADCADGWDTDEQGATGCGVRMHAGMHALSPTWLLLGLPLARLARRRRAAR